MPKVVDHAERRAVIGEAVWKVLAERGADAVTVREIARRAEMSTGVLAHYFANRHEMLLYALQLSYERATIRTRDAIADVSDPDEALEIAIHSILPLDDQQCTEYRVWLCFWGHAVGDQPLNDANTAGYRGAIGMFAELIKECQSAGSIPADADPTREARALIAMVDGLGVQAVLSDGLGRDEQLAITRSTLDRLRGR